MDFSLARTDKFAMNTNLTQVDLLSRLLNVSALRHKVIAQNVANIDTPGYQRLEVNFEEAFHAALKDRQDAASLRPEVVTSSDAPVRADGNNVSIDSEMGALSKNTLLYQTAAQLLTARLATLRAAVTGR